MQIAQNQTINNAVSTSLEKSYTLNGIAILIASPRKELAALAQVLELLRKLKLAQ